MTARESSHLAQPLPVVSRSLPWCLRFIERNSKNKSASQQILNSMARWDDSPPVCHRTWLNHRPWIHSACHCVCWFRGRKSKKKSTSQQMLNRMACWDDSPPVCHRTWLNHRPWFRSACHCVCGLWERKSRNKSASQQALNSMAGRMTQPG